MVKKDRSNRDQQLLASSVDVTPFINGDRVVSGSEETLAAINPATGEISATIPVGCEADINHAVQSSKTAFDEKRWTGLPMSERKNILTRLADLISANASELDHLDAIDMGKPIGVAAFNAQGAADLFRNTANAIDTITGDVFNSDSSCLITQGRAPRGVVGAIVPWNFPAFNTALKCAPALAAGNSVVLKPSESSSQSAMRIVQLAAEAGMPAGVFNLVPGIGATVGKALALHNDVDMITFTGSTQVGKLMLQYAGQSNMKLVHAECGGKSPQIVFDDFEGLDTVAEQVASSLLLNQGQVCSASTRLLVQQTIAEPLIEKIAHHFKQIVAGDPLDPKTNYGPLVNQAQMDKVLGYINTGQKEGATLVTGGQQIRQETGGFYIEPTLFSQVKADATIAREEIFGPVLSVISFEDEQDAIDIANNTLYGLIAHVWTTNMARGMSVSKQINAGTVFVNGAAPRGEGSEAISIEPYGQSGIGMEMGHAGLDAYLRRQTLWFNH